MIKKQGANSSYFKNLTEGISSSWKGLTISFRHLLQARKRRSLLFVDDENYFEQQTGIVTTQYPYEAIPIPDNGRYRLNNEIDDCIVCDKCAKVCPVDCIDIVAIKATEQVGVTSDGSPIRLYAGKFDIDMAKCCYCGLCTTVCPTECLTMTKTYDYSEEEITNMIYHYSNLSPAEVQEKLDLLELFKKEKEEAKRKKAEAEKSVTNETKPAAKPKFRPKPKSIPKVESKEDNASEETTSEKSKPKFRPKVKPKTSTTTSSENSEKSQATDKPKPKFRPKVKPKINTETTPENSEKSQTTDKPKPKFRPKVKPKINTETTPENSEKSQTTDKPKPKFRPKVRPKINPRPSAEKKEDNDLKSEEEKDE